MTSLANTPVQLQRIPAEALFGLRGELEPTQSTDAPDVGLRRVPRELRVWLARLRLLEAVPFSHLVADAALLPPESIRFFHLDRGWTDALVEGALSVGTATTVDRAILEQLYAVVRDEVDEAERLVRLPGWTPGADVPSGPAGPITGFLLRSRMVSGWPGLHVRAYGRDNLTTDPKITDGDVDADDDRALDRIGVLRMERLAPAVLLVLFDGLPRVIHLEEPRAGVQYGVEEETEHGRVGVKVAVRDVRTGDRLPETDPDNKVDMPFRKGAPGVVHVAELARRLEGVPGSHLGGAMDSAEFGIQMLQFPWRAVFGDQTLGDDAHAGIRLDAVFNPAIDFISLNERFARRDVI